MKEVPGCRVLPRLLSWWCTAVVPCMPREGGALQPEVTSHPKAGSGFKSHSGWWVQILPVDAVAELLQC